MHLPLSICLFVYLLISFFLFLLACFLFLSAFTLCPFIPPFPSFSLCLSLHLSVPPPSLSIPPSLHSPSLPLTSPPSLPSPPSLSPLHPPPFPLSPTTCICNIQVDSFFLRIISLPHVDKTDTPPFRSELRLSRQWSWRRNSKYEVCSAGEVCVVDDMLFMSCSSRILHVQNTFHWDLREGSNTE